MAGPLPELLAQIDPSEAWQPWEPSKSDPWNLKWAGHLYRRAAFGASWTELQEAVRAGFAATLARLLQGQAGAGERDRLVEKAGAAIASKDEPDALRGWWLYLLLQTLHPLQEKLTLFWHNHFATSIAKVNRAELMFRQNLLLRRHALAKFGPLLLEISRDPAMLIWLDSNTNVKGAANENYARELLELFSLGVGHYAETDVREAARAFTGWQTDGEEFEFVPELHDAAAKQFLGQAGPWNGDDISRIVLKQRAAALFLVRKLYRFFISEDESPADALLEPLAQSFRQSDYDIAFLLKTLLGSRLLFSNHAYRKRVKSPVEFVVGICRTLGDGSMPPSSLVPHLEAMGQPLFAPPNVKGWAGGKAWLNTATILARDGFARSVALPADLVLPSPSRARVDRSPQVDEVLRRQKVSEAGRAVRLLVDMHLQGDVTSAAGAKLVSFLAQGKPSGETFYKRARELVVAIWNMPEYQLA